MNRNRIGLYQIIAALIFLVFMTPHLTAVPNVEVTEDAGNWTFTLTDDPTDGTTVFAHPYTVGPVDATGGAAVQLNTGVQLFVDEPYGIDGVDANKAVLNLLSAGYTVTLNGAQVRNLAETDFGFGLEPDGIGVQFGADGILNLIAESWIEGNWVGSLPSPILRLNWISGVRYVEALLLFKLPAARTLASVMPARSKAARPASISAAVSEGC